MRGVIYAPLSDTSDGVLAKSSIKDMRGTNVLNRKCTDLRIVRSIEEKGSLGSQSFSILDLAPFNCKVHCVIIA